MSSDFVMLPRDIRQWRWYRNKNTLKVFLHLVLSANYTDCGFEGFIIRWGQVATSYDSLCRETGLSVQEVRTAIKHLKSTGDVTVKKTPKFSIITIENFNRFQRPTGLLTGNQQACNKQATGDQQQYNKEQRNKPSSPLIDSSNSNVSQGEGGQYDIWESSRALLRGGKQ